MRPWRGFSPRWPICCRCWSQICTPAGRTRRHERLQGEIGVAFRQLATVSAEAARERSAYFNADPDAQPLIDLVLRLRHDIVMMGRAAAEPLPADILQRLDGPIEQFGTAARDFLLGSAAALTARVAPPPLAGIEAALAAFSEAFTGIRRDGLLRNLPTDTVERVFALAFSFEQMRADFADALQLYLQGDAAPPKG